MKLTALACLSRLPLAVRRRLLWAGWSAWLLFNWRKAHFGTDDVVTRSLKLGRRDARRIGRAIHFQDQLQTLEWIASATVTPKRFGAEARHVRINDPALFERLAATGDPVILAPMHMGNISIGVAHLMKRYFNGRRVLVLRAKEDVDDLNRAMARLTAIASELRIVNTNDKSDFVDAMRFARQGAVIVCFADLPSSYGSPATVSLFGQEAQIALGLDTLARIVKGIVVPLAVHSAVGGDTVFNGRPFEVSGSSQAERERIAAGMARQMERFIYAAPSQWHFWPRMNEFRVSLGSQGPSDGIA